MTEPTINEHAVTIASALVGYPPSTVYRWIDTALSGTKPLPGSKQHDGWVAYQAAVAMAEKMPTLIDNDYADYEY